MAAKLFPQRPRCCSDNFMTFKRETFAVWMKSLVFQTNGCTVFDSNGHIVYRVENYDQKCSNEVYLMDLRGRVLVTIIRKKRLMVFGRWYNGYKWNRSNINKEKPWFQSNKYFYRVCIGNSSSSSSFQVTVGFDKYWVVKLRKKSAASSFRIVDRDGDVAAEVLIQAFNCELYNYDNNLIKLNVYAGEAEAINFRNCIWGGCVKFDCRTSH